MSANSPPGKSDGEKSPENPSPPIHAETVMGSTIHDEDVDTLQKYLAEKLGFDEPKEESPPVVKVLHELSLDGVARWMKKVECQYVITLAGAGISTSAGIPDFRSPKTGLYHNLQKYNLPEPQSIFELDFFRQNPKPFFTLAKELFPGNYKPTTCHYFIKLLEEKGYLLRHYTQNIDALERGAGIPADKIVEAHGNFLTSHCIDCTKKYPLQFVKDSIFDDEIPICESCSGIVKPDIVFFGESLPERFQTCLREDFQKCDLLIIMGSSLEVQPFASLIDMVPQWCPRLLINREKAGHKSPMVELFNTTKTGLQLDGTSVRDVMQLGECDKVILELAYKLDWGDELRRLVLREHLRLDKLSRQEALLAHDSRKTASGSATKGHKH